MLEMQKKKCVAHHHKKLLQRKEFSSTSWKLNNFFQICCSAVRLLTNSEREHPRLHPPSLHALLFLLGLLPHYKWREKTTTVLFVLPENKNYDYKLSMDNFALGI